MFLAKLVFSFRPLCLKPVVTDFVLAGMFGPEGMFKSKPEKMYWRFSLKTSPICFFNWYFVVFTLKPLQFLIVIDHFGILSIRLELACNGG